MNHWTNPEYLIHFNFDILSLWKQKAFLDKFIIKSKNITEEIKIRYQITIPSC